jgi:hypothetical protein
VQSRETSKWNGFFLFLGAGDLKSAVTFEISVPKLFFLLKMLYEDFYYEIYSTFIKLNYSLGEIERNLKMKLFFFVCFLGASDLKSAVTFVAA